MIILTEIGIWDLLLKDLQEDVECLGRYVQFGREVKSVRGCSIKEP